VIPTAQALPEWIRPGQPVPMVRLAPPTAPGHRRRFVSSGLNASLTVWPCSGSLPGIRSAFDELDLTASSHAFLRLTDTERECDGEPDGLLTVGLDFPNRVHRHVCSLVVSNSLRTRSGVVTRTRRPGGWITGYDPSIPDRQPTIEGIPPTTPVQNRALPKRGRESSTPFHAGRWENAPLPQPERHGTTKHI
jgi:hypothetical protein